MSNNSPMNTLAGSARDEYQKTPAGQEATRRVICVICSISSTKLHRNYGVTSCNACRNFIQSCIRGKTLVYCKTGRYDCDVTRFSAMNFSRRSAPCRGCRLKKALNCGLDYSWIPTRTMARLRAFPRERTTRRASEPSSSYSQ